VNKGTLLRGAMGLALGRRRLLRDGTLALPGLRAPITLRRDRYDIAYIEAQDDFGAWFGLGYCQGQDRAFQLELRLRTVRGTLSELFGEATLGVDRLSRRIGFIEASQHQFAALDTDVRQQIEAFVQGINAGMTTGATRRAPEFVMLNARPTPWTVADVVAQGKLISFLMIGNWDVELARLKILLTDGEQALRDLDPAYPASHPVTAPVGGAAGQALDRLSDDLARFVSFSGAGGGSNAWAVSGAHTATGRPLLASDPHLDPSLPPHWYLTHLRTPEWSAAGATMIGAPAFGVGHNGFCAWGITAGLADTVDLFVEDLASDKRAVRRGDGWEPVLTRREVIKVKKRAAFEEDVSVTPRGPIIGPALQGGMGALSLSAVWLQPRPARGLLMAHKARSLQEFRDELAQWPLLSVNVVYADAGGQIAWQLAGELPQRIAGNGTLPLPAADLSNGWLAETLPFKQMPFAIDPPEGFVATANAKPVRDDANGPLLGVDWLDGFRQARIVEALQADGPWDLPKTMRLQVDKLSHAWRDVKASILALTPLDDDAHRALDLLREWDGTVGADSVAATIYELFIGEMWRRVAKARAPQAWEYAIGRGFTDIMPLTTFAAGRGSRLLARLVEQPDGWFGRGWPAEMADALSAVVKGLRKQYGERTENWTWGAVRPLTLVNPLGRLRALAPVFNRGPYAWGGDGNTVSQAGTTPVVPAGNPTAIASLRAVIDVGEWENSRFVMPGGQSGDPFSPHYDDLLPLWLRGEGVPIAWTPERVRQSAVSTLYLLPLP
jgi:penicillin amidase